MSEKKNVLRIRSSIPKLVDVFLKQEQLVKKLLKTKEIKVITEIIKVSTSK